MNISKKGPTFLGGNEIGACLHYTTEMKQVDIIAYSHQNVISYNTHLTINHKWL